MAVRRDHSSGTVATAAATRKTVISVLTVTAVATVATTTMLLAAPSTVCNAFVIPTQTGPMLQCEPVITDTHRRRRPRRYYQSLSLWQLQASSSTSTTTTTTKNKKTKKQQSKNNSSTSSSTRKTNNTNGRGPSGQPMTLEELTDHVHSKYTNGPGGPMNEKVLQRGLVKSKSGGAFDSTTNGAAMGASNASPAEKVTTKTRANLDANSDSSPSYTGLWGKEQEEYLKMLNGRPALVLNADYMPLNYLPLSLWSWQDAVKAIFSGKVVVVDVYPDVTVRASNIEVPLPSIIALTDYVPHKNHKPAFTRRNVFLRDEYRCQYCGNHFHTADLSLDHVVPRSHGGILSWENAVTSCLKCNGRKGSMPLKDLKSIGMKLLREPRCPSQLELAARAARMVPKRVHPTWKPYLGIAERPSNKSNKQLGGDEDYIDDRYFEEAV